MHKNARRTLLAVAAAAFLLSGGEALANHKPGQPHGNASAVDQYVEQVPTSSGSVVSGQGGGQKRELPRSVQKQLADAGGEDATVLEDVATSSDYGAPQEQLKLDKKDKARLREAVTDLRGEDSRVDVGSAVAAPVSVLAEGNDGRLLGLVIVMALIALATVAAAAYRQRAVRHASRR